MRRSCCESRREDAVRLKGLYSLVCRRLCLILSLYLEFRAPFLQLLEYVRGQIIVASQLFSSTSCSESATILSSDKSKPFCKTIRKNPTTFLQVTTQEGSILPPAAALPSCVVTDYTGHPALPSCVVTDFLRSSPPQPRHHSDLRQEASSCPSSSANGWARGGR